MVPYRNEHTIRLGLHEYWGEGHTEMEAFSGSGGDGHAC